MYKHQKIEKLANILLGFYANNLVNLFYYFFLGNVHVWNLSSENHQSILHEKDSSIQSVDIDAAGNMIAAITNKGTCYMSAFPNRYLKKKKSLTNMSLGF